MSDESEQQPLEIITGEMSEEAIEAAALTNDTVLTERLESLYESFKAVGDKATLSSSFDAAQNGYANAMNIATSIHKIALVREQIVRARLDKHTTRTDPGFEPDEFSATAEDDPVEGL